MANTVVLKLVCALVVCIVATATYVEAEVTCNEVKNDLGPCLSHLKSGGAVPNTCCNGLHSLYTAANNTPARQTACQCVKQLASGVSGINEDNANSLPGKCGISVGFPISSSVDCSEVQ